MLAVCSAVPSFERSCTPGTWRYKRACFAVIVPLICVIISLQVPRQQHLRVMRSRLVRALAADGSATTRPEPKLAHSSPSGAAHSPRSTLAAQLTAGTVDAVAPTLLGAVLRHGEVAVRLTEVEAYGGADDAGSHAARGCTQRNAVMFGPPGHLYVYLIYGMHCCANVVCGPEGSASAVLVRAGEVIDGIDLARARRPGVQDAALARGPACLCKALGIDRSHDGARLCGSDGPEAADLVRCSASQTDPAIELQEACQSDGATLTQRQAVSNVFEERRSTEQRARLALAGLQRPAAKRRRQGGSVNMGLEDEVLLEDATGQTAPELKLELPAQSREAYESGPRVGLRLAADWRWRFWVPGDATVSAYRPAVPRARR